MVRKKKSVDKGMVMYTKIRGKWEGAKRTFFQQAVTKIANLENVNLEMLSRLK